MSIDRVLHILGAKEFGRIVSHPGDGVGVSVPDAMWFCGGVRPR